MKNPVLFALAVILASAFSCTPEKPFGTTPLTGVWELVSGQWSMGDSAFALPGPGVGLKSMKYYGKDHFFCIGMNAPGIDRYAFSGEYTVNGDKYTEKVSHSTGNNIGQEYPLSFQVSGDTLNIKGDWFHETWIRVE
jgi:hypothetical protein